jgi:signal transduction histidine kinase
VADLSEALTRMAKTLDQRARYITAFAASVSHEFKTPLAALRGAAELLDEPTDSLPTAERQRLLAVLTDNAARLDRLVRRLLELARADMMRPGAAPTPIAPILAALVPHYTKRGLAIDAQAGACTVALPEDAIEAILASLLDNVLVHAGAGAHVCIRAEAAGGVTRIDIQDDGPGISPANATRVFEPFFTTARASGGTGLGLPIVQAIARGAGGNVVLLTSGHGTHFRIELPAAAPKEQKFFASFFQKRRLFFSEEKKQKTFIS